MNLPITYLNTPHSGLISSTSYAALDDFNKNMTINPSETSDAFRMKDLPLLRELISEFSSARTHEFALIPNTSFGLNSILPSIKDRCRVLYYEKEYHGLTMPFDLRDEYEVFTFPDIDDFHWDLNELKETILKNKIDLFVFSSVQWLSGYRTDVNDLCAFCKDNGVLTILDISQEVGAMRFSFAECAADVSLTSNYKWMNAGFGSGILWAKSSFLENYTPVMAGYNSAAPNFDFANFEPNIRCYEPGHLNLHAFVLLSSSIKEKMEIGTKKIEEHNRSLTQTFISGAMDLGYEIVGGSSEDRASIAVVKGSEEISKFLKANDVMCSLRGKGVRLGFHHYNNASDVERTLQVLSDFRNT